MNKIRVLLANHPVMVPQAIRKLIEEQDDMEVVADLRGPMKILQETGRVKADVIVMAQEGVGEIGLCSQLLAIYPDLIIVSTVSNRDIAFIQQLRSHRERVLTSEQSVVLRSVRTAVRQLYGASQYH